ncbi:MAG: tRNA (adenosine(37)-N6)-dimethylallyltransferase MiaA [Legionellales bacterium]
MPNRVFCLMGPTASGKTALAAELIKRFPFEIISVDSAMIYREMNIGTAKPTSQELQVTPHHLINIRNPDESYSAAQFCTDALALSESIILKGKIPLLVGGTMMYFNALQKGLSVLPEANNVLRQQLEDEAATLGWGALHQRLTSIDPHTASRIHAHDAQRIQRALEVYYLSGHTLSELQQQKVGPDLDFITISLFPEQRSWLHLRIAQRFEEMLALGFVDEVFQLTERWHLHADLPSMRSVGYRQVMHYLQQEYDYPTMREKGIAATRQLAKRQLTWLRHWEDALVYDPQKVTFSGEIIAKIAEILDNKSSLM